MCDDVILSAHILYIIVQLRTHCGVRISSTQHDMRNGWIKVALFASHLGPAMRKAPALVTSPSVGKNDFHTSNMYCAMPSVSTSEITSAGSAGCTLPVGAQRLAGTTPTSWHLAQEVVQNVWLNVNTSDAVQAWDLALTKLPHQQLPAPAKPRTFKQAWVGGAWMAVHKMYSTSTYKPCQLQPLRSAMPRWMHYFKLQSRFKGSSAVPAKFKGSRILCCTGLHKES